MRSFSLGGRVDSSKEKSAGEKNTLSMTGSETVLSKIKKTESNFLAVNTKIYDLGSDDHKLSSSIAVILKYLDDEVLAIFPDLDLYGEGKTEGEALSNLKEELIDLFEHLNEIPDSELGAVPKGWKRTINSLIEKINGN